MTDTDYAPIAERLREIVSRGLTDGVGVPGGMLCIESAIAEAMGEPHGDEPSCTIGTPQRDYGVRLNDAQWSSPQARAAGMLDYGIAHLGAVSLTEEQQSRWREIVVTRTIGEIVPIALRAAARAVPSHAGALESAARRCETERTREAAQDAYAAAAAATAADAYAYAAAYAAAAARVATATATADYACAVTYAANCAYAAAAARAATAARDAILRLAARDDILRLAARIGVDACREVGCPGEALL
jgi:hypothetical protein